MVHVCPKNSLWNHWKFQTPDLSSALLTAARRDLQDLELLFWGPKASESLFQLEDVHLQFFIYLFFRKNLTKSGRGLQGLQFVIAPELQLIQSLALSLRPDSE